MSKLYRFSSRGAEILSLFFTGFLLLSGFLFTSYARMDLGSQKALIRWDSPLWNIVGILLFLFVFFLALRLSGSRLARAQKFLLIAVSVWILFLGAVLILFGKSVPSADAYTVYHVASRLAEGDTSVIHPTQSYLSYYPQQIGLVAFYEPLIRLWNLFHIDYAAYHFLKIIYVFLGLVIFYFQYLTVHFLFKKDSVDVIYLLLSALNFPFILYTSFLYSEIPSFAAISIGLYTLFRMFSAIKTSQKKESVIYMVLSLLFLALSVQLRKNSLILIIAVVIVSFFTWCRDRKKHSLLLFTLLCIVCSLSILPLTQKVYELRAGNTLKTGVTAMSYFAMGMQEAERGYGWYNGFNFITYEQSGLDSDIANEISRAAISERLDYFSEHPAYAATFYFEKYLSQWVDGTYACRQAVLADFGGRHAFFTELYEGKYGFAFIEYCNALQNVVYLGAFLFCLGSFRKKSTLPATDTSVEGLPVYVGLIAVLGGFLFHMLWEANSRYIFLYGMLLLPYAACGLEWAVSLLRRLKFPAKKESENNR